jgi:hypothetical protein
MRLVSGVGLEVGAMHQPVAAPPGCSVEYLDVAPAAELAARFPEVTPEAITVPQHLGDVGLRSVREITGRRFGFVVLNHVLEHVPNPIRVLEHTWDGVEEGGALVVGVPDKRYCFDRLRRETPFEQLLAAYYLDAAEASDDRYADFVAGVHPERLGSRADFVRAVQSARRRREHVHVWRSETFRQHLARIADLLGLRATLLFESDALANGFEYFAVLRRRATGNAGLLQPDGRRVVTGVEETVEERTARLEATIRAHLETIAERDGELRNVRASRAFRLASALWALRNLVVPPGTRRRSLYDRLMGAP